MRNSSISPRLSLVMALCTLTVLLVVFANPAEPHTSAEVRGGYHLDAEDGFVGGGLNTDLDSDWYFNPNFEWVLVDGYDLWSVNADFHRDFPTSGPALWLGGGPALIVTDSDGIGNSHSDFGLNLLGGIGAKTGSVRPFGQMKVTLSDNSSSSLAFGIRF